jgi:hypothetical protein
MIQFIRYCDDPEVQAAAARLVGDFPHVLLLNPAHFTIAGIMRELTRKFGHGARNVQIWIH